MSYSEKTFEELNEELEYEYDRKIAIEAYEEYLKSRKNPDLYRNFGRKSVYKFTHLGKGT